MSIPQNPSELFTPFLPSTYNLPEEDDRIKSYLTDNLNIISDVVNDKKIGTYAQSNESFNGEKWYYKIPQTVRTGFQTIAYIPSFPNVGTLILTLSSIPKFPIIDILPQFVATHVWGSASKPCTNPDNTVNGTGDYFSFFSEGNSKISFTMSNKRIVITTTTDMTAYSGFIVVEYIRNGV
jgi:hypothetical protein